MAFFTYYTADTKFSKQEVLEVLNWHHGSFVFGTNPYGTLSNGEYLSWGTIFEPINKYSKFALSIFSTVLKGYNPVMAIAFGVLRQAIHEEFLKFPLWLVLGRSFTESDLHKDFYSGKEIVAMSNDWQKAVWHLNFNGARNITKKFIDGFYEDVENVPTMDDAAYFFGPSAVLIAESNLVAPNDMLPWAVEAA